MKGILSVSLPLIYLFLLDPAVQLIKSSFFITVVDLERGYKKKKNPPIFCLIFFQSLLLCALSCFSANREVSAAPNHCPVFLRAACLVISDPCYSIMGCEFGLFDDLLAVILPLTFQ